MEEIWKDIEGYEGKYRVSNLGNVLSLNYKNHGYPKQLTPKCNNRGRLHVELILNKKRKSMLIHRLVAMAFIPNPEKLPQINHKDENPKNNNVENLEWCTGEYNIQYSLPRVLANKKPYRTNVSVVQCAADTEKPIRIVDSIFTLCVKNNWRTSSIKECCEGKRKTAYGFKWQYAN